MMFSRVWPKAEHVPSAQPSPVRRWSMAACMHDTHACICCRCISCITCMGHKIIKSLPQGASSMRMLTQRTMMRHEWLLAGLLCSCLLACYLYSVLLVLLFLLMSRCPLCP